ncbi:MAG: signal peptidase I [SAR324 cluster bacterium]|jgi:signal peptidase I|nr:signal peptidase I [SAR324 cluster bacterium]MCH2266463.1 signal peptidase I [SAR324 cluster bacterium]|tara:strand:- start:195 stop:1049 length:855 start_codon:yes stop_codon:yes gene_type:complete
MFVTYKLSDKSFNKLQKKGLSEAALNDLEKLKSKVYKTPEIFLNRVRKLSQAEEILQKEDDLLKIAKGFLRLDYIIPNRTIREWIEALIFAVVVATVVRTYMFAPFQIPSGSMLPTIQIGDHIFASMYSYGSPVPFTEIKLFKKPILRGDIIIFPYPRDPSIDYIKRAVGLPGETLEIRLDKVYINGELLDEPYAFFEPKERISRLALGLSSASPVSSFGPISIPEGKLFAMGDNRYNSADSRYWGFVDINTVSGKGQIIYWSHDPGENLLNGYQLGRIFDFLK